MPEETFDDVALLRQRVRELNDVIDQLRRENGDLGERMAVLIQRIGELERQVGA